ncbi:hypothetical protein JYK21_07865 [Ralstonia pickettii]|nr:hypothetical protein [Ralstonia pickettii]
MSEEELQKVLDDATTGFPEQQIDYVVGDFIILGYESMLNAKGRAEARAINLKKAIGAVVNEMDSHTIRGGVE